MIAKQKERNLACEMRKKGYSFSEISENLKVSKSSASLWTRNISLSKNAQKRLHKRSLDGQMKSQETLRSRTRKRLKEASLYAEAVLDKTSFNINHTQILCALIYWCEGEKSKNDTVLSFTNSDPLLAATFIGLLRGGFKLDESKFRVCIHLHDYHNKEKQLQFWSQMINVSRKQFMKSYLKPHTGKQKKENYAGCASIRYYDAHLARRINAIARGFMKEKCGPIG